MPSIARALGLLLIVASSPWAAAQRLTAEAASCRSAEYSNGASAVGPWAGCRAGTAAPAAPVGGSGGELSLPGRRFEPSVPLPAPTRSDGRTRSNPAPGLSSLVTVAGSLAVVLGIFFLVAWGMRRASPVAMSALPEGVFETLGRAPLAGRQQAHLLRLGNKLVLVSVTPAGAETITEITDPVEVDRLAGLCRQAQPHSTTAAFRQVFQQFAPQGAGSGVLSGLFGKRELSREAVGGARLEYADTETRHG